MRLLYGDTCGSSSGARALRPPGSRSGRNQARGPDGRRTLLDPSAVGHDSHRTPTGPPAREIFALRSALFHKRRIRHGAHPYFQFLAVGPFSSARGLRWDRPIPLQFREERSQNATICSKISRSKSGLLCGAMSELTVTGQPWSFHARLRGINTNKHYCIDYIKMNVIL